MKITVDSMIYIENPVQELIQWCNDHLIVPNPAYAKMIRMGRKPWNMPQNIVYYTWYNGNLILPRGLFQTIWNQYPDKSLYENRMNKCKPVEFQSDIKLRDYQQPSIAAVKSGKQGIIVMPCGSGKTETALQIIADLRQPALWITHTKDLLNQSLGRAREKLHLLTGQYGVIGGGEYTIGSHITFSTVQSLKGKDLNCIKHRFGTVVIDECHRAFLSDSKMSMFQQVMEQLPALYRIGVTASEHRSDGLIQGMYHMLGNKIYEVDQTILNDTGNVVVPKVTAVSTNYTYGKDTTLEFGAMLAEMVQDNDRNALILDCIMKNKDHNCLILGDRLSQLQKLAACLDSKLTGVEFVHGSMDRKSRDAAITRMRAGDSRILLATYTLAKEGLDIPILDRLFLATPHRDKVAVQQSVGRIMRPYAGKGQPIVYDFVDPEGVCQSQYKARKSVYRKLGCVIEEAKTETYHIRMKGCKK